MIPIAVPYPPKGSVTQVRFTVDQLVVCPLLLLRIRPPIGWEDIGHYSQGTVLEGTQKVATARGISMRWSLAPFFSLVRTWACWLLAGRKSDCCRFEYTYDQGNNRKGTIQKQIETFHQVKYATTIFLLASLNIT